MTVSMAAPLLDTAHLTCGYTSKRNPVLREVNLQVRPGETVVLVGPSGSGKSTLLKTLLGLVAPLGGGVRLLGKPQRPPRGSVGYIPQSLGLVRYATVLRNVLLGTLHQGPATRSLLGIFSEEQLQRARCALEGVRLAHKADELPVHLSGGERRRVALARAMAQNPCLLLADEVLSELDHHTKATVLESIRSRQRETSMGVLMVEHDLETACNVADLLLCVGGGTIAAALTPGPHRHRVAQEVTGA